MVSVALPFRLFFDEAVAETVDGLYRDGKAFFRYRVDDAVFQFLAGPVGKGQAEDFRPSAFFCAMILATAARTGSCRFRPGH